MSGFTVDPTELFGAGARVSEAAADGDAAVTRVRLEAADLFVEGWAGAAAAAFRGGFDDWLAGARLMLSGLEDLASALTAAGHDYTGSERATGSNLHRVAVRSVS